MARRKETAMKQGGWVKSLYYITHINNMRSILEQGILSHQRIESEGISFTPIYDAAIVSNRRARITPDGKSLWEYANLFFQPRNPMLYRVISERDKDEVAVLALKPQVLDLPGVLVTTGNAASPLSEVLGIQEGRAKLSEIRPILKSDWWREEDGSKRKIMAECLVPDVVPAEYIHSIYVASEKAVAELRARILARREILREPHMFFQPTRVLAIVPEQLLLVDGDMFFSQMQTLTISVNTVGVMGKGLASRAKYQFPDTYVVYQDVCRQKILQMGTPYLYRRETSFEHALADDPHSLQDLNSNKWFLLFATKRHWREPADAEGIEQGLKWIKDNYSREGIESLAVPALGCGLGGLKWREVGPLMGRYLAGLDIQVSIYLPREEMPPPEQLSAGFLLGSTR
jgi:O-acetyl-ADP-ribose deacetylase (regulator of RNase III)